MLYEANISLLSLNSNADYCFRLAISPVLRLYLDWLLPLALHSVCRYSSRISLVISSKINDVVLMFDPQSRRVCTIETL